MEMKRESKKTGEKKIKGRDDDREVRMRRRRVAKRTNKKGKNLR